MAEKEEAVILKAFDALKVISGICAALTDLAWAFEKTGNAHMAESLSDLAIDLATQSKIIRSAISQDMNEQSRRIQADIGATLKTFVEVIRDNG